MQFLIEGWMSSKRILWLEEMKVAGGAGGRAGGVGP
jgi:hypothetical protein